ncbi:MAG TPA: HAD family hydrolase [Desulfuromonadales bacterium]|nr:HAD family hydrolase [Desulfuromonadales bacterium]
MVANACAEIRGIVFDLDGTLYVCDRYAAEIHAEAVGYIAALMQISTAEAGLIMAATRLRLVEESGTVPTISAVCTGLGGNGPDLHRVFLQKLRPEAYLVRDERVIRLLKRLAEKFTLAIYTNNNRALTARIMNCLGLDGLIAHIFTIDDTWRGKPDEEMVCRVLAALKLSPEEALFVGDRYDVDLRVPEQLGCPVYLSQHLEQLLRLEELISRSGITPSAGISATPADRTVKEPKSPLDF